MTPGAIPPGVRWCEEGGRHDERIRHGVRVDLAGVAPGGDRRLVWGLSRAGTGGGRRGPSGHERAREILQERFARGELTEQEYRERMRVLDEH